MSETITIRNLAKRFGDQIALDDVSLSVAAGSIVGLLGPNGAGKTTLINCLTTLLAPDAGTVTVAGHDVDTESQLVRASIALTGQFAALDEQVTPRENLVFFGRLLGLSRAAAGQRADELLEVFELSGAGRTPVGYLSGGMRRRLDLAVSLVVPRPVLVLDEPTTGLDPRSRKLLWDMVRAEAARGVAVLLTTQYLDEADQLADRIVVVDHGRVIAEGASADLKREVGGTVCRLTLPDERTHRAALSALRGFDGVSGDSGLITVLMAEAGDVGAIIRAIDSAGLSVTDIEVTKPTLDEVFFAITEPRQAVTA